MFDPNDGPHEVAVEANVAVAFFGTRDGLLREPVDARHALAPARGIVIGLILSGLLWALVIFVAMHL